MSVEALIRHVHHHAGTGDGDAVDSDSLIGIFQAFRPDGKQLPGILDPLAEGKAIEERLDLLFSAAGEDRRPQGGRDAYFVVRNPPKLDPDDAEQTAIQWLTGLRSIAEKVGDETLSSQLDPVPEIRVLEGTAPKHPKDDAEKSELLLAIQNNGSALVSKLEDEAGFAKALRPAFYFTACDAMLRDYLMWPIYAERSGLTDPLEAYFKLWRHGVKYRVFRPNLVDIYLPRS